MLIKTRLSLVQIALACLLKGVLKNYRFSLKHFCASTFISFGDKKYPHCCFFQFRERLRSLNTELRLGSRLWRLILINTLPFLLVHTASAGPIITGLDFPGSTAVSTTMRFKFINPQNNGLPAYDATYIWRAYPRHQTGYYTTFFWGNDDGKGNLDTFLWDNGGAGLYYGAHPYPRGGGSGTIHDWEIALGQNDYVNGQVVYNRWYTQALRVWSDANGKHHEFYWDLPNLDSSHLVTESIPARENNTNPPSPALNWGDAPWAIGNEVYNGILRGIQIYATKLSLTDILKETQNPLSTNTGATNIWYLNLNPTPTDISDKSGKGHNPMWVGNRRPSLYTENTPGNSPNAPSNLRLLGK